MKKLLLTLALISSLTLAPTKKAEAGLTIVGIGALQTALDTNSPGLGVGIGIIGLATTVGGVWLLCNAKGGGGVFLGLALVALESEQSPGKEIIEQTLTNAYPFIDNSIAISNLAKLLKSQAPPRVEKDQKYLISLTEADIRLAVEGADLTEAQLQKVVSDLK